MFETSAIAPQKATAGRHPSPAISAQPIATNLPTALDHAPEVVSSARERGDGHCLARKVEDRG